jgi:hypothetical protein
MNHQPFYAALRPHLNLTTENVMGMEKVLAFGRARGSQLGDMAYILATAWWETAQTMQPVIEAYWLSEDWRRKNLRYYPWHGRGLIQTTWERNYQVMGNLIGVDLIANPDLLLEWEYALPALFVGMEQGVYTGKKLSDYIDNIDEDDREDLREFANARRIVNGTDKQIAIGELALKFEAALKAVNWSAGPSDIPLPRPRPAGTDLPEPATGVPGLPAPENALTIWQKILAAIFKMFR